MKVFKILTTLIISLVIPNLYSQPNVCELYTITKQAEIDSFSTLYPNCISAGALSISGPDITSLEGLSQLTSVEHLSISNVPNLNGYAGLNNITYIYDLYLIGEIPNVAEFNSLSSIGNNLLISSTPTTSIQGFVFLESVGQGGIVIANNPNLVFISAFDYVTSIGGVEEPGNGLQIANNPNLELITGFDLLNNVNGPINSSGNNSLQNLDYLHSISSCKTGVTIEQNLTLQSISGLSNLTSIDGPLAIHTNLILNSISGIHNIDPNSISGLMISSMPMVDICNYPNICEYLSDPDNPSYISGVGGCESLQTVLNTCVLNTTAWEDEDFSVYPNPVVDHLSIDAKGVGHIEIFNTLGQKVMDYSRNGEDDVLINMTNLDRGIYFIKMWSNSKHFTKKIIKS